MDDVLTAALATDEDLCTYSERMHVTVGTEGKLTKGQTIAFWGYQINQYPERERKNVRIARTVQGKQFIDLFVDTIVRSVES